MTRNANRHLKVLSGPDVPSERIFASPQMKAVVNQAVKIAQFDSTILITGESGVGKEVIADLVQKNSKRSRAPFVKVNCGAIPESLAESEFFGYMGGSFTGSNKEGKQGLFEAAHNGTIFLDEISELPLALQPKLLRVLQSREINRIGSTSSLHLNVRIIAATNRNLRQMVLDGLFREDLFYRISVVPIHIPPLRERKTDIVAAIEYFTRRFIANYGVEKRFSQPVLDILLNYHWMGNMRELENVIEQILITSEGNEILTQDVPYQFVVENKTTEEAVVKVKQIIPLSQAVLELERQLFLMAVDKFKTTRKIAKALSISQSSVMRKLKILGIEIQ